MPCVHLPPNHGVSAFTDLDIRCLRSMLPMSAQSISGREPPAGSEGQRSMIGSNRSIDVLGVRHPLAGRVVGAILLAGWPGPPPSASAPAPATRPAPTAARAVAAC